MTSTYHIWLFSWIASLVLFVSSHSIAYFPWNIRGALVLLVSHTSSTSRSRQLQLPTPKMVLRVSNKRIVSNVENTPPTASSTLKVASSVRRALADASRRRTRGVPNKRADHAASVNRKRRQIAKKTSMVTIIVPRLADPDVEMSDSTSRLASTISTSMKLPRHLARVEFPEVASESIAAIRPELEDADLQFIRDTLAVYGTRLVLLFFLTFIALIKSFFLQHAPSACQRRDKRRNKGKDPS